jgi:hypothetical protein
MQKKAFSENVWHARMCRTSSSRQGSKPVLSYRAYLRISAPFKWGFSHLTSIQVDTGREDWSASMMTGLLGHNFPFTAYNEPTITCYITYSVVKQRHSIIQLWNPLPSAPWTSWGLTEVRNFDTTRTQSVRDEQEQEQKKKSTRVYPKVPGLAAWSENCKWYSSLPLVQLYCYFVSQSSEFCLHNPLCCSSMSV